MRNWTATYVDVKKTHLGRIEIKVRSFSDECINRSLYRDLFFFVRSSLAGAVMGVVDLRVMSFSAMTVTKYNAHMAIMHEIRTPNIIDSIKESTLQCLRE